MLIFANSGVSSSSRFQCGVSLTVASSTGCDARSVSRVMARPPRTCFRIHHTAADCSKLPMRALRLGPLRFAAISMRVVPRFVRQSANRISHASMRMPISTKRDPCRARCRGSGHIRLWLPEMIPACGFLFQHFLGFHLPRVKARSSWHRWLGSSLRLLSQQKLAAVLGSPLLFGFAHCPLAFRLPLIASASSLHYRHKSGCWCRTSYHAHYWVAYRLPNPELWYLGPSPKRTLIPKLRAQARCRSRAGTNSEYHGGAAFTTGSANCSRNRKYSASICSSWAGRASLTIRSAGESSAAVWRVVKTQNEI